MKLININAAVCIVWLLTYLNFQHTYLMKKIQLHSLQRVYRKLNYKFLTDAVVVARTE